MGLNSYWKPSYHPTLPYKALRSVCDFDAPQVYWRGYGPTLKLVQSKQEYGAMSPKLPFALPAGDMYIDRGIKPTPEQVVEFMTSCWFDSEIQGVVMWSMDQKKKVPELWDVYARFNWKTGKVNGEADIPPVVEILPLYSAVVAPYLGLNVRLDPSTKYPRIGTLRQGDRVDVYGVQYGWAWIDQDATRWVSATYLKRV